MAAKLVTAPGVPQARIRDLAAVDSQRSDRHRLPSVCGHDCVPNIRSQAMSGVWRVAVDLYQVSDVLLQVLCQGKDMNEGFSGSDCSGGL